MLLKSGSKFINQGAKVPHLIMVFYKKGVADHGLSKFIMQRLLGGKPSTLTLKTGYEEKVCFFSKERETK